ncbi:MAG: glycosyltransferase family 4 protein [Armatimonadota bacterium]
MPGSGKASKLVILPNVDEFPSVSMSRFRKGFLERLPAHLDTHWDLNVLHCSGVEPWMSWFPDASQQRLASIYGRWVKYPRAIRHIDADVYHILDHSHATLAGSIDPARTVVTCFDIIPLLFIKGIVDVPYKPWVLRSFLKRIEAMRSCARVLCVSQSTRNDLITHAGFTPEQISIVPIGLEADFQAHPPGQVSLQDEQADFAMRHKLDQTRAYILQVGTRNRYKNTPVVLEVLAQLKKAVPNVALLRVGADFFDDEKDLRDSLGLRREVFYLGRVSEADLRAVYRFAKVLHFPSLYEGFGWPVLEAMASGCPVLASDRASLPEVVGDLEYAVDPESIGVQVEKLHRLIADSAYRDAAIVHGLERASGYSWDATAHACVDVYAKVLRS